MFNSSCGATNPKKVVDKLVKIMQTAQPTKHYIIGKDALLATTAQWLGLGGLMEDIVYKRLKIRAKQKKKRDKRKK